MAIDRSLYTDSRKAIRWLDVDPGFDSDWPNWSTLRTYVYVPGLRPMADPLAPIDYFRLASIASSMQAELHGSKRYAGLIKHENVTIEQIKYLLGTLRNDQGLLKPLRLDKALLGIYAINFELNRLKRRMIQPTIFLSAFGIRGIRKYYNGLDKATQGAVRKSLAAAIDQAEVFAEELLKGRKVSIDAAIGAFDHLSGQPAFARLLAGTAIEAIEAPSQRHFPAAQHEDFARGRLAGLPAPFQRPAS